MLRLTRRQAFALCRYLVTDVLQFICVGCESLFTRLVLVSATDIFEAGFDETHRCFFLEGPVIGCSNQIAQAYLFALVACRIVWFRVSMQWKQGICPIFTKVLRPSG